MNKRLQWVLGRILEGRITKDGEAWPPICLERERTAPRMWGQTLRTVATGVIRCRPLLEDVILRGPAWDTALSHSGQGAAGNCAGVTRPQLCCRTQVPVQPTRRLKPRGSPSHPGLKRVRARPSGGKLGSVAQGHAGRGLKRSANRSWLSSFAPTTIFPFVRGLCVQWAVRQHSV